MWEWCLRLDASLEKTELCYIIDDKDYDCEDDIVADSEDDSDDDQMPGRRNCVTSLSRDNTTSRNEYKVTTLTTTISKGRDNIDSKDCFDLVATNYSKYT